MTPTTASTAKVTCRLKRRTTSTFRMTSHIPGSPFEKLLMFATAKAHTPFRSPNAIPPLTKTQYFYKKHQSATVFIPNHRHHHHRSRIPIEPDENETESYVTKVDTTHLGARKHQKRFRDDDESHQMKPFFRTGELIDALKIEM